MSGEGEIPPAYQQQNYPPQNYQQQPMYQQQPVYQQQPMYQQQPVYVQQPQQVVYTQQPQQVVYTQQPQQQVVYTQQPVQQVIVQQTVTTNGVGIQSTTIQQGEAGDYNCGSSSYGTRMDFKKRQYKDVGFLVGWVIAMIVWFILLIAFGAESGSNDDSSSSGGGGCTGACGGLVARMVGMFVILITLGIISGYFWMHVMFRCAKTILKTLIGIQLLCVGTIAVIFLAASVANAAFILYGIIWLLVFLFLCLYYWCIRRRLRLAAAMIRLGTKIVQTSQATIMLQFGTSMGLFSWWVLWISVVSLWVATHGYSGGVFILMLFMWYWTSEVLVNVAHVTTCGVAAVWWFNKQMPANPTWQSYRFATSKGLGSICYGSFLVAIIQTLRAIMKSGANRGGIAALICYIFLSILNCLARYFNSYAFVQVALYGATFWQAAKDTWSLLSSRGIDALINDDLSNMVLRCGAVVGGLITMIIGGIIAYAMFVTYGTGAAIYMAIFMGFVGWYIGYYFTLEFMFAIRSAITAVFVLWAEDPQALQENHPACYNLLATAWAKIYGNPTGTVVDYEVLRVDVDLD